MVVKYQKNIIGIFKHSLGFNNVRFSSFCIKFKFSKKATENDKVFNVDLTLIPCPFTGWKMFCPVPNFLSQPKNLTAFSAGTKTNFTE